MKKESFQCQCQQLSKKLKIAQSDYQFQVKKLNEDKSQQKVLFEISMQKQIRRIQEKALKEKQFYDQQNKRWLDKYDNTVKQMNSQMIKIKQSSEAFIVQKEQNLHNTYQNYKKQLQNSHQQQIVKLSLQHKSEIDNLKKSYEINLQIQNQKHTKQIKVLNENHEEIYHKKVKELDSMIVGVKSQKKTEEQLHLKTKKQAQQRQTKLYEDLYQNKKKIISLETEISDLKKIIQQHKSTIVTKDQYIEELKITYQKQSQQKYDQYQTSLENERKIYQDEVKQIYTNSILECKKYEQSLKNIQEKRQFQIKIYQQSMEEIQNCVQQRPSKLEDIQQISFLKSSLAKKQKQLNTLMEQVKFYRLELQNKEQTYNKIFVSNGIVNNQNFFLKRKQFKLRRAGKSITAVRDALASLNSGEMQRKNFGSKYAKIL